MEYNAYGCIYIFIKGKRIAPFCTHEGSGLGRSTKDIGKLSPESRILQGLAIYGSKVKEEDKKIEEWLKNME